MILQRMESSYGRTAGAYALAVLLMVSSLMGLLLLFAPSVSAAPSISIMTPSESDVIYERGFDLNISVSSFELNGGTMGGSNVAGQGHWHLKVDGSLKGMYSIEDIRVTGLSQGSHILEAELVNNDHTQLSPRIRDWVNITVSYPGIGFTYPPDGSVVYGGSSNFSIEVSNFTLSSQIGGENIPGYGFWQLAFNYAPFGNYTDEDVYATGILDGNTLVLAQLKNNDGSDLDIQFSDEINVWFHKILPELNLVGLPDDPISYTGSYEINVEVDAFNLTNVYAPPNIGGWGHYQVYVDDMLWGSFHTNRSVISGLSFGMHDVRVELVNRDGSLLIPRVYQEFELDVSAGAPMIEIMEPSEGDFFYTGSIDLQLNVMDFILNASAIGSPPVEGEGHYHLYIDDQLVGPSVELMRTVEGILAGMHTLKVELVNNDHTSLDPMVMDQVNISIIGEMPEIMITRPMSGAVIYDNMVHLDIEVENFTFDAEAIGMDPVPSTGHYHLYLDDVLVGPYADPMVILEDLPVGEHEAMVMLVNNDHTPVMPMVQDMVDLTVSDNRPMITIKDPMEDSLIYGSSFEMEVMIEDLVMNGSAIGMAPVPGEGHYHVYLDEMLVGPYSTTTVMLEDLAPGDHELKVELVNNDHSPLIPRAMDMVNLTILEQRPMINIMSPADGAMIYDDMMEIEVMVSNFTMNGSAYGMEPVAGEGHYHIFLDDALVGPFSDTSVMLEDLSPGDHVLKAMLYNNDHSPIYPETMDMVHFTIMEQRPSIMIMDPMDGAVFYSDTFELEVMVENFSLNASSIGMPPVVGEGHYHIYLDGDLVGPFANMTIMLEDLPAGMHELKVMLMNNDHSPIMPYKMDMVHFIIVEETPSISIIEPVDGAILHGDKLHVEVMVENFIMNSSAIGGNNSVGEGHWHLYIDGVLLGPKTEMMLDLTGLPFGTHELMVDLRNNDHSPLMPAFMDKVTFTLMEMPTITIVSPVNGTTLDGNDLDLEVEVANFILNSSAVGGSNKPGEGHYHIYLDEQLIGPFTDLMVTLSDLSPGDHILKVDLRNNDHSMLGAEAMDMIHFTVPETATEISVTFGPVLSGGEPLEGAMVKLMFDGETKTSETDTMGKAEFTLPVEWEGMEVQYEVSKEGYGTLKGTATIGMNGTVDVEGSMELQKKDEGSNLALIIVLSVLVLVVIAVMIFVFARKPTRKAPDEE